MRALPEVSKVPGRNLKSAGRVLQTQAAKHGKQNCMAVLRRDQTWKRTYNAWSQVTAEENNAGQNWSYAYDRRGLAVKVADPNGTVTEKVYDKAGHETAETKTNGTTVNTKSWSVDGKATRMLTWDARLYISIYLSVHNNPRGITAFSRSRGTGLSARHTIAPFPRGSASLSSIPNDAVISRDGEAAFFISTGCSFPFSSMSKFISCLSLSR